MMYVAQVAGFSSDKYKTHRYSVGRAYNSSVLNLLVHYERYSTRRPPARRTPQFPTVVNGSLADTRTYGVGADVRQIRRERHFS